MNQIQITLQKRVVSGPELETLCIGYEQQHGLPSGFFKSRFEKFAKYGDENTAWAINSFSNFELDAKQVAATNWEDIEAEYAFSAGIEDSLDERYPATAEQ